jgi:hypothetical protein
MAGTGRSDGLPIAACDREGVVRMTVLHSHDGTDFSLVCDGCGMVVEHLGASLHTWTFAWSLFSRHGWIGASTAGGPHACARCMVLAGREPMTDEEPPPTRRSTVIASSTRCLADSGM